MGLTSWRSQHKKPVALSEPYEFDLVQVDSRVPNKLSRRVCLDKPRSTLREIGLDRTSLPGQLPQQTHLKAHAGNRVKGIKEVEAGPVEPQRLPDRHGDELVAISDKVAAHARERGVLADERFVNGPEGTPREHPPIKRSGNRGLRGWECGREATETRFGYAGETENVVQLLT